MIVVSYSCVAGSRRDSRHTFWSIDCAWSEVQKIELAPRPTDDEITAIKKAIAELASENFNVREQATQYLIKHDRQAFSYVVAAQRDKDPEVANRATEIVEKLKALIPENELNPRQTDSACHCRFEYRRTNHQ